MEALINFALSERSTQLGVALWFTVMAALIFLRWRAGANGLTVWMMVAFISLAIYHAWVGVFVVPSEFGRWDAWLMKSALVITITGLMVKLWRITTKR